MHRKAKVLLKINQKAVRISSRPNCRAVRLAKGIAKKEAIARARVFTTTEGRL